MSYAPSEHWDEVFRKLKASGRDLDWQDQWVPAFVEVLRPLGARNVLELGCGTGNDAVRLAHAGFVVSALDFSAEAIAQARQKSCDVRFVQADMAKPLPFEAATFDAVVSNVALHMFSDDVTRRIFGEIGRVLAPRGVFAFHVNSLDDMPLRQRHHPRKRELEPFYFEELDGQTMRFFTREYLAELLVGWEPLVLQPIEILAHDSGEPFKRVWRDIFRRP